MIMKINEVIKLLDLIPITEEIKFKIYCDIGKVIGDEYKYATKDLMSVFKISALEKFGKGELEFPHLIYQNKEFLN